MEIGLSSASVSGTLNMIKINQNNNLEVGSSLEMGDYIEFPINAGLTTFTDFPISSSTVGESHSYDFNIGGQTAFRVYGESDGLGSVKNYGLSSVRLKRTLITTHYTASMYDYLIAVSSSTAVSIYFPNALTASAGRTFIVKDEGGTASLANISLVAQSATTYFDGAISASIVANYNSLSLYSNGSNWFLY